MLFWIILGILILILISFIVAEIGEQIGEFIAPIIFMAVIIIILVLTAVIPKANVDATIAEYQVRKEVIELKLEYLDEIDEDNFLLYEGFQDVYNSTFRDLSYYNREVAKKKALANNFWVGIWYPNEYEQLELIDTQGGE